MKSLLVAGALALAVVMPAAAQERGVARRTFTFLDTDVTVEVTAPMPGTLQIVRGEPGILDVAGRVPGGMSSFALGGRDGDKLRLTAVGGEHADFIVVVPEDAYVRVRLPNRKSGALASTRQGATFTWGDAQSSAKAAAPLMMPPSGPTVAHSAEYAPRVLAIPRLTTVRSVEVRLEASDFQVAGNHYMTVVNGSSQNVEVRTGDEPEELIVTVPAATRDFTLRLGGRTALVVRRFEVTTYCEPVTEQTFAATARRFTFTPEAGRLTCR